MGRSWLQFNPRRAPIVSVRIQRDRYRALIDTGADVSLIAPELSLRLGLPSVGTQVVVALNGNRQIMQAVQLPPVGFGDVHLEPCRAAVCQVSRLGLPIELILGVNAFAGHRLQFDFKDGRIYIVE
jgi:predicted aspartyl protease